MSGGKKGDDFDRAVDDIQRMIEEEEEKVYTKEVLEEYRNPKNFGVIENPDARANFRGPCGDVMDFSLRIEGGKIVDAKFVTDGCGATVACGSKLTTMIKGMEVDEAMRITNQDLEDALGGLPDENKHCAVLAVTTLKKVIEQYRS